MNQVSQYIFNLYHFLLNVRDTAEFVIDREHPVATYNQRKDVIVRGKSQGYAFGNFLEANKEQTAKFVEKLDEFVEDIYGENSTILMISGDQVRVDHSQNIKILEETVQIAESVRDVVFGYLGNAKKDGQLDATVEELIVKDERLHRVIIQMLLLGEYQKSFGEFQKVMTESKGQPTPQSNFIVQNELAKLAGLIRFNRQHCHVTDNYELDLLEKGVEYIEMTEGRRARRDDKNFKDLYEEVMNETIKCVREYEPQWKECFDRVLKDAVESQKNNPTNPGSDENA